MNSLIRFFRLLLWPSLLLLATAVSGQSTLRGTVTVEGHAVEGIEILNIATEQTVQTDANGNFSIEVQPDEMLVVLSEHFEYYRKLITTELVQKGELNIALAFREGIVLLDEVEIKRSISAENLNLGLSLKPRKTAAEADYYTEAKYLYTAPKGGIEINLNAIFNVFKGHRRLYKQALITEQHRFNFEKLRNHFDDEYLYKRFKIQRDQIYDFLVFASMQPEMNVQLKNVYTLLFTNYMLQLAEQYRQNTLTEPTEPTEPNAN